MPRLLPKFARALFAEVDTGSTQKSVANPKLGPLPDCNAIGQGSELGWWANRARKRSEAASCRLHAAHLHFDDSVVALRKAALDHVDCQDLASTALRANLDRIARRMGTTGEAAG